jgi:surface polysaccharide O-acyltransferase-like enzyme
LAGILIEILDEINGEKMHNSMLFIVIGSSVVFIGILIWKVLWLIKKINSAPAREEAD